MGPPDSRFAMAPERPTLPRTGRELLPFEDAGGHVDRVRLMYWRTYAYCEREGLGRGPIERERLARRATRAAFLMLAAEMDQRDVARELRLPLRTVERALQHLHRASALALQGRIPEPTPLPIPRRHDGACGRRRARPAVPAR